MKKLRVMIAVMYAMVIISSCSPKQAKKTSQTKVPITFKVKVPDNTKPDLTVHIVGNLPELGRWNPGAIKMKRQSDGIWQITLELPSGKTIRYKYTLGSWETVEKGAKGEEIRNRKYKVPDKPAVVEDEVKSWASQEKPVLGSFGPVITAKDRTMKTLVITYYTTNPEPTSVNFGKDGVVDWYRGKTNKVKMHHIEFKAEEGVEYTFEIKSSDPDVAKKLTFKTPPATPTRIRFVVYGDTRTHYDVHEKVVKAMSKFNPVFVINTGDLVGSGYSPTEWTKFFRSLVAISTQTIFIPVMGNHEKNAKMFFEIFELPQPEDYFSYDIGDLIHITILNTDRDFMKNTRQYKWFVNDLSSAKAKWKIVVFHRPPYTSGYHHRDREIKAIRKYIVPVLEENGVDIVFNGHDHTYERSVKNGITYVVTGGGGAPLYPFVYDNPYRVKGVTNQNHFCIVDVNAKEMKVKVLSLSGKEIDSFTLKK